MFKKLFGQLQRIGKALMLPVAIYQQLRILLAFGNAMHNEQLVEIAPWLKNDIIVIISSVMKQQDKLYLITCHYYLQLVEHFGLAGGDGVAALAASVRLLNYECNNGNLCAFKKLMTFSHMPKGQKN
ncbi:hypothetical protein ACVPOR_12650 [Staphylococcus aureus]